MGDYERAASRYLSAKEKLAGAIIEARREGISWTDIGRPLGISKQAAQQKFGSMVNLALYVPQMTTPVPATSHAPATTAYDMKPRHADS